MSYNASEALANAVKNKLLFTETHQIIAFVKGAPSKFLMNTGEIYTEDELKQLLINNSSGCINLVDGEKTRSILVVSKDEPDRFSGFIKGLTDTCENTKLTGIPRHDCGTPENIAKLKSSGGLDKLFSAARME